MSTYEDEKKLTSMLMGRVQYGDTGNDLRNELILSARREIFDRYNFSWLLKPTTLTLSSNLASLPSDYNPIHLLRDVRVVNTSSNDDYVYQQVRPEDIDSFATGSSSDFTFYIEREPTSGCYQMITNQLDTTVSIKYYHKPTDMTANTDIETIPNYEAVSYKAAAKLWLAKERDETNHDRFDAIGERKIMEMIVHDRIANPMPKINTITNVYNLGYNDNLSNQPVTSYESKA